MGGSRGATACAPRNGVLVTVPAASDEVKCGKRLAKFVCFLYAVSELGFHVSMDVAHGNPYLTV